MMKAFTKNYQDNSSDAGFEFTFLCDVCNDGFKSSFIASDTYKKNKGSRLLGKGAGIVGNLIGGKANKVGNAAERGGDVAADQFSDKSPQWRKEHENAFGMAQNEAKAHFHRCPGCNTYSCDHCWNEDATLCTTCAPRQDVMVAQAHAKAMKRNIDAAEKDAVVWQGNIESKTTICPICGKPAGTGKFCNNCGASLDLRECPKCGAKNALTVRFCNNCGENLSQPSSTLSAAAPPSGKCAGCGFQNDPETKFCGGCGSKL
ncbi:MAG: zinc ribbon domain-containing protein [Methanomassiliicoccaceae archaeon]|nr:zinc ribbon domain-containing protein [Methanomassiliicoccaceae archaeon]